MMRLKNLKRKELNRKALKKSFWSSISKVIGIGLSAGAGSMIRHMVGDGLESWTIALSMAAASFIFVWFSEYERET